VTSSHSDTDSALVSRIEGRDADALAALYDRHASRLMGLAHRILGDTGEAEEVLQEVFLYVWRSAASFDATRGTVLAWLLVVARSRAIDRVRSRPLSSRGARRDLEEISNKPGSQDVEADSVSRQWESLCRSAIADLPADQRRVLELAYYGGLTHQEIADETATPLGTVKTRVRLGLMKLRERIRPYLRGEADGA
jgi:RNA polymerase sigma-70 factor (ECF subfamily)